MKNNLYLKYVSLSGYKSINDVNIGFQKGLNIIIGKNAAGKTNFLKFLSKLLFLNYDDLTNFKSSLVFDNGNEFSLISEKKIEFQELLNNSKLESKSVIYLKNQNKILKGKKKNEESSINDLLIENDLIFDCDFICHGIPKDYIIVDNPFKFNIAGNGQTTELFNIIKDRSTPYFIKTIIINLLIMILDNEFFKKDFSPEKIRKKLNKIFVELEKLKNIFVKYSPIEDFRFSENYNIFLDKDKSSFTLNNLYIEFKIDGNWIPFSSLSDGTKRLFYIISEIAEVLETNDLSKVRSTVLGYYGVNDINRIILLEEPELGIHPHQFHKLLEFLKEESENKQIIITTHSPQALDAIKPNELDRITIAYSTNTKEGTKLRHLNENEILKANEYIKEDFLSDYWLYSDLEK